MKIPDQCRTCLNLQGRKCIALVTLETKPCFSRTVDPEIIARRRREIGDYERKYLSVKSTRSGHRGYNPEKDPKADGYCEQGEQESKPKETGRDRLNAIKRSEIMACMAEDMARGNGKGGSSEKEKAPNKKTKSGKTWIDPGFEGFL